MTSSLSKLDCQVAVIGAGPYGLSVAAHLRGAKLETRVFGEAMSFWERHMPKGMKLRSQLVASDLGDPNSALRLEDYAARHKIPLVYPFPREDFVSYGKWFQKHSVSDLDTRRVVSVNHDGDHFDLTLEDSTHVKAQRVVVATGLANQEFRPAEFSGLSTDHVSHTSDHSDLSMFAGKRVAVVGRGQSACESAALLNVAGADVELVSRGPIRWIGSETSDGDTPENIKWRLHAHLTPRSGVGPFPLNWLVEFPSFVRQWPQKLRSAFNARCLKPASTSWVKPGFVGVTTVSTQKIHAARQSGHCVEMTYDNGPATYDHVLLATGYRIDISKLNFISAELLRRIARLGGSPALGSGLQSSVPGLHFVGSSSVMSYGPLMRFVAGADYAARHLTQHVVAKRAVSSEGQYNRQRQAARVGTNELYVGRGN
jgi:hypothetical protein